MGLYASLLDLRKSSEILSLNTLLANEETKTTALSITPCFFSLSRLCGLLKGEKMKEH